MTESGNRAYQRVLDYVRAHPGRPLSVVRERFACTCDGLTDIEWSLAVAPLVTDGDLVLDHERRLWPSANREYSGGE